VERARDDVTARARLSATVRTGSRALPWLVLCVLAGSGFAPFFTGSAALVAVAAAAVLAAALAVAVAAGPGWLRRPEYAVAASAAGYLLFAVALVALRGEGGGGTLAGVGRGLRDGWALMLTIGLPADPTGELLVLPTLLVWVATVAAVLLALRTSATLAPVVPPLVLYLLALAFTAPVGGAGRGHALAVTSAGLIALLLRVTALVTDPSPAVVRQGVAATTAGRRWYAVRARLVIGAPLAVVCAVLAAGSTALLPAAGTDRADPRDLHAERVSVVDTVNPLVEVRTQLLGVPREVLALRLSVAGGRLPARWRVVRVAVLDRFDGASWQPSAQYRTTGTTLRASDPPPVPAVETRAAIRLTSPESPFVPTVGQPSRVDVTGLAYDPESGTLVDTTPAPRGRSYELRALVPSASDALLRRARPDVTAPARYLAVPAAPDLRRLAEVRGRGTTAMDQLTALTRFLRDPHRFPYDVSAAPGHSLGTVRRMLVPHTAADQRGAAEQHAAAFAVLARLLGFPTRIAVGYLLTGRPAADGSLRVTTATAHAWPEVKFQGLGWVPFEPTDTRDLRGDAPPRSPLPGGESAVAPRTTTLPPLVLPEIAPGGVPAGPLSRAVDIAIGVAVVVAGAMVLSAGLVLAEKARRRLRRRSGLPAARVAGAWREVRDRLRERGVAVTPSSTPAEVAVRASSLGEVAAVVGRLAPIVTASTFSAAGPGEDAAHRAWELEAEVRRVLVAGVPLRRRAVAALDPRPLLRPRSARGRGGTGWAAPGTGRP
jgi:transglutaminase-like putative cysteine protease